MRYITFFILLATLLPGVDALAQPKRKNKTREPEPQGDVFTLRYKPQVGTLYYDVQTTISHNIENKFVFPIKSVAQLALETKDVDHKSQLWTYDYFFRELKTILSKYQIPHGEKDSVLNEVRAIGKKSRVTYSMLGKQVSFHAMDTSRLSGEAQFFSFFFQPPRLLAPLPEKKASYGTTWEDARRDTVRFLDTLGIEQFANGYSIYDLKYVYKFERLQDTVDGSVAVISSQQTGSFKGVQFNTTGDEIFYEAPITGSDTTYLDLLTGRVLYRDTHYSMPVIVKAAGREQTSDILDIRSIVMLNIANIRTTAAPDGKAR
ncbi:MAG TPA: hypothetical protein VFH43_09060 [Candidatus Kapabacteria bacterium]|nr:hypothetical protein [Candidatus Kapabacteria bacterium]